MTKVINFADMKQRVAETEAKLSTSAQEGRKRNVQLLGLLDAVEKTVAHNQRQISLLEEAQGRALEEVQQLRNLLHVLLTMAENVAQRGLRLAVGDLEQLIDRLGTVASKMNQDAENGVSEDSAKEPPARTERERLFGTKKRARTKSTKKPVSKVSSSSGTLAAEMRSLRDG